jgi:hypothetical protein
LQRPDIRQTLAAFWADHIVHNRCAPDGAAAIRLRACSP